MSKPLQLVKPPMKPVSDSQGNAGCRDTPPIVVRLRDLPATPGNLDRIRRRVHQINHELTRAGAPFRLRLV
jgi:hypothetical protein